MPQTQSSYLVSVRSARHGDLGTWTTLSGGNVTGDTVSDRDPTQEYPTQSGGEKSIGDLTITRRVQITRDTDALMSKLADVVGVTNDITVGRKPLDSNRAPFGKGTTWIGTLTDFQEPDSDNNSVGEAAVVSLTVAPSRRS